MKAHVSSAQNANTKAALAALVHDVSKANLSPDCIFMFHGCTHDGSALQAGLEGAFPNVPIIGGSSSGGVMDQEGIHSPNSVGLLVLADEVGEFGAAMRPKGNDPAAAAREALESALAAAGCEGEMPDLIWIYQTPGGEEDILRGLYSVVGDGCPIIGGSAADDTVEGNWSVFGPEGNSLDAIAVAVLFPSGEIGISFKGGYAPTNHSGIARVCSEKGARVITHVDDQPAAQVYNRWSDNAIADKLEHGGSVLADTTLYPMAVDIGKMEDVDQFILIHPETVQPDGALTTFANVTDGARLHGMKGDPENLVRRAGSVATEAVRDLNMTKPVAAIVVYCGGCRLAVGDRIDDVQKTVKAGLEGIPFVGAFTFGEQGFVLDKNFHGNLMISTVVFGS
ncbi:MAG: FIST signal transduction protein [Roseobacter sp.]